MSILCELLHEKYFSLCVLIYFLFTAKDCPLCRAKSPTHVGIPCGHGICCDCANQRYHSTGEDQIDPFVNEVDCLTCQSKVKLYALHLD